MTTRNSRRLTTATSMLLAIVMLVAAGATAATAASAADKPSKWTQVSVNAAIQVGLVPESLQRDYSKPLRGSSSRNC